MSMNLRENKMDDFTDEKPKKALQKPLKKKPLFGFGQKKRTVAAQPQKHVAKSTAHTQQHTSKNTPAQTPVLPKRALRKTAHQRVLSKPLPRAAAVKKTETPHAQHDATCKSARQNWTRKKDKPPLPKEKLNYQKNSPAPQKIYSRYIKERADDVIVHWRGPEFEHYPHERKWYIGALLILALIVFYAVIKGGIIMAILFTLIGLVGYLLLTQPQKVIDFAVTYEGILVNDEIFPYDNIKSFWIFYEPPHTRVISLHMRGFLRPYLHVPLHQVDPVDVHKALVEFVPEVKQEENMVDVLERLLRI